MVTTKLSSRWEFYIKYVGPLHVHGIVELKTSFDHLAMIYDKRMICEAKRNAYFLNPKTKMLPFHVLCCRTFVWLKFFSSHHQSFWISF